MPCAAALNTEYKRCSSCVPGLGALTGSLVDMASARLPPLLVEMVKEEEKPHVQPAAFTYLQQPRNPPNFSGKGSELAHLWLKDYSRVAAYNGWDESMCLANVVFFLEGAARCWFDNVEESITTWNTFKEEFTRTFGDKEDYVRRIESSLKVRAQKPDESVELYIQDVLNLCRQLNPNMSEEDRVGHLMKGVAENIYQALLAIEVTTTGEFTQHCRRIEKLNKIESAVLDLRESPPFRRLMKMSTTL
ncbi:hypothetical protein LAZ67_12003347 [Cordylochernes scorpioides]|uniref:Retrotransposon gag domain-containing protein n=1 Tax=Cordylochernes scorpioides TaxID=51811 RepID=A0ABY6L480_9ARAC|nr:hypothetical protein LAZ67_12003347 [Cordylochernes scorpioides]